MRERYPTGDTDDCGVCTRKLRPSILWIRNKEGPSWAAQVAYPKTTGSIPVVISKKLCSPLSVAHHPHYSLPSINQCEFLVNCTRTQISLNCYKYLGSELEALNWASTCLSPAIRYLSPSMFLCGYHARSPYHGVRANCTSTSIRTVKWSRHVCVLSSGVLYDNVVFCPGGMYHVQHEYYIVKMEGMLKKVKASYIHCIGDSRLLVIFSQI